jgi:hypothetical protein
MKNSLDRIAGIQGTKLIVLENGRNPRFARSRAITDFFSVTDVVVGARCPCWMRGVCSGSCVRIAKVERARVVIV